MAQFPPNLLGNPLSPSASLHQAAVHATLSLSSYVGAKTVVGRAPALALPPGACTGAEQETARPHGRSSSTAPGVNCAALASGRALPCVVFLPLNPTPQQLGGKGYRTPTLLSKPGESKKPVETGRQGQTGRWAGTG